MTSKFENLYDKVKGKRKESIEYICNDNPYSNWKVSLMIIQIFNSINV